MSSEPPKPGAVPGWDQQPADQPAPTEPQAPAPGPEAPGSQSGAIPGWGAQPAPAQPAPAQPASPGWGAQPAPNPQQAPTADQPQAPVPAPPATPPPTTPPPGTGWGAAPPAASPGQPAGGWGGPPSGPQPMGGGAPPGAWNPQPAAPSSSNGCLRACLIVAVIGIVLVALIAIAFVFFVNRVAELVGVNSDGSIGTPCAIISDSDLSSALGSNASAIELSGFFDATIGLVLDKRVLPDAQDCWITSDGTSPVGRIARYEGSDAAEVFQQERQNAAPTSQGQGNGVSVESSGYFAGDVSGLGDEAFCTGLSPAIQAGVLVRQGSTLVYVSLSGPSDGSVPDMGTTADGVITAPSICATAQDVARKILH